MKKFRYLFVVLMCVASLVSCKKHELIYDVEVQGDMAQFQFHYFEPVAENATNYVDSVKVNDVLYSSYTVQNSIGQLIPYNAIPGGGMGRFFNVAAGNVNFKMYRKGVLVYDQNATLKVGRQNLFVYNMNQPPIVLDNEYPYWPDRTTTSTAFGTDSICSLRFINFMFENATTPYPGKLKYQFNRQGEVDASGNQIWNDVGDYIGFGETTPREILVLHKSIYNSSGYQRFNYRVLKEDGTPLYVTNTKGKSVVYSDYWNAYIGRVYNHIFCGIRTVKSPAVSVRVWYSL